MPYIPRPKQFPLSPQQLEEAAQAIPTTGTAHEEVPAPPAPPPRQPKRGSNPLLKQISPRKFDVDPKRIARLLGI